MTFEVPRTCLEFQEQHRTGNRHLDGNSGKSMLGCPQLPSVDLIRVQARLTSREFSLKVNSSRAMIGHSNADQ